MTGVKIYYRAAAWLKHTQQPHIFFSSYTTTEHIDPNGAIEDFQKEIRHSFEHKCIARFPLLQSTKVKGPNDPILDTDLVEPEHSFMFLNFAEVLSFSVLEIISTVRFDTNQSTQAAAPETHIRESAAQE